MIKQTLSVFTLFFLFISCGVHAGKLDDLERDATTPKSKSSSSSSSSSKSDSSSSSSGSYSSGSYSSDSSISSKVADKIIDEVATGMMEFTFKVTGELLKLGVKTVAAGGATSTYRYQQETPLFTHMAVDENDETGAQDVRGILFRKDGDPILPTLRLTSHWMAGSDDVTALQSHVEAGYGLFGVSYTQNRLEEPDDALTLEHILLHYRMAFGNNFSWDFAYGRGKMNGNQKHEGDVFAMPMRLRFKPNWHVEYYPVWSSYNGGSLSEHQLSLNYHYKHVGVTAGIKKWSAGPTTISGGFAGLYLSF